MASKIPSFYERVAPVLLVIVVALAFSIGILWQKVSSLESGRTGTTNTNNQAAVGAPDPQLPPQGKLTEEQAGKLPPISAADHVRGSRSAEVFIVEYSDFECPFCASFHTTAQQAVDEYGGRVAWVYRHFPLDSIHPKARPAANASECIAELGGNDAFWAFADEVFTNQTTALVDIPATAAKIGVNRASFETCFNEGRHETVVESQYQQGIEAGVTGTPGNFVINSNGDVWLLPGAVPFESLKITLDEALAS